MGWNVLVKFSYHIYAHKISSGSAAHDNATAIAISALPIKSAGKVTVLKRNCALWQMARVVTTLCNAEEAKAYQHCTESQSLEFNHLLRIFLISTTMWTHWILDSNWLSANPARCFNYRPNVDKNDHKGSSLAKNTEWQSIAFDKIENIRLIASGWQRPVKLSSFQVVEQMRRCKITIQLHISMPSQR